MVKLSVGVPMTTLDWSNIGVFFGVGVWQSRQASAKVFIDDAAASTLQLFDYYRWVCEGKPEGQQDA